MAVKRGRTITNFGQAFTPLEMSGAAVAVPPTPTPTPEVTEVAGAFYSKGARLTERLTEDEWRRLIHRPDELNLDELQRERAIALLLSDEELLLLL